MKKKLPVEKVSVQETTKYDNFVGKKETIVGSTTLPIDIEESQTDHWVGMPEFEQEDNPAYKTIYLHFRNKEDFEEFSQKYFSLVDNEQKVTMKTKSMWYPHLDRDANSLKRWMEE